jgi:hypothetical protein
LIETNLDTGWPLPLSVAQGRYEENLAKSNREATTAEASVAHNTPGSGGDECRPAGIAAYPFRIFAALHSLNRLAQNVAKQYDASIRCD